MMTQQMFAVYHADAEEEKAWEEVDKEAPAEGGNWHATALR